LHGLLSRLTRYDRVGRGEGDIFAVDFEVHGAGRSWVGCAIDHN
jgi:hypothetical protein